MSDFAYLIKFIIIGDASRSPNLTLGVGKSCLLIRFLKGEYRKDMDATIGVEFGSKRIKVDDLTVKLQI